MSAAVDAVRKQEPASDTLDTTKDNTSRASLGGQALVQKYGKDYMASLGRKGSNAVVRKYGLRFYSEIAARNKGVKKRRATQE